MYNNCPYCSKDLTGMLPRSSVGAHIRWCKPRKKKTNICEICGNEHNRRSKYCSKECSNLGFSSKENLEIRSISRIKYLSENPDKHPWKRQNKNKSKPCETVKEYLKNKNIKFVDEWQPLKDRFYSIDIAFPDIKLGIEINGNQHYEDDGSLRPYYRERHEKITNEGWTLVELHYLSCFNEQVLDKIFLLGEQPDYSEYFRLKEEQKNTTKKTKYTDKKHYHKVISETYEKKWEPFKQKVIESEIDFTKFGWVKSVSIILGIKYQNVNSWMKKFLPKFYEEKCFKRKPPAPATVF